MNVFEKLKRSWWVLLSFVIMINGVGFIYAGFRHNNRNWVFEGVIYEIPWLFSIVFVDNPFLLDVFFAIAMVLWLIGIIRSVWVAIKLDDVYDNEDKYTVRPTVMNKQNNVKQNDNFTTSMVCCICLIFIFFVFAIAGIL